MPLVYNSVDKLAEICCDTIYEKNPSLPHWILLTQLSCREHASDLAMISCGQDLPQTSMPLSLLLLPYYWGCLIGVLVWLNCMPSFLYNSSAAEVKYIFHLHHGANKCCRCVTPNQTPCVHLHWKKVQVVSIVFPYLYFCDVYQTHCLFYLARS